MTWALQWADRQLSGIGEDDEQTEPVDLPSSIVASALLEEMRSPVDVYRDANREQDEA